MDNVDGDITSRLTTFGVGAVSTTAPTASSSPYVITYTVTDTSGNAATPGIRYVIVACKSPKVNCTASDGTLFCSSSAGLCIESTATAATTTSTSPTIKLIGQAVLGVTEGTSYLACPTPQPTNVICDRYAPFLLGIFTACIFTACIFAAPSSFLPPECLYGQVSSAIKVALFAQGMQHSPDNCS